MHMEKTPLLVCETLSVNRAGLASLGGATSNLATGSRLRFGSGIESCDASEK